jgi:hypothetical protein
MAFCDASASAGEASIPGATAGAPADAATARQTLYEAQVHAREAARVQHRA